MVNLIGPQLTVLVILILEIARSAPRSTIHQWLSSGADQKHVSSVNKPSSASPGSCSAWELLDVAGRREERRGRRGGRGGGGGGEEGEEGEEKEEERGEGEGEEKEEERGGGGGEEGGGGRGGGRWES